MSTKEFENLATVMKKMKMATEYIATLKTEMEAAKIALINSSNSEENNDEIKTTISWQQGIVINPKTYSREVMDFIKPIFSIEKGSGYKRKFFFELIFIGNYKPSAEMFNSLIIEHFIHVLKNEKGNQSSKMIITLYPGSNWLLHFMKDDTCDFVEVATFISNFLEKKFSELKLNINEINP